MRVLAELTVHDLSASDGVLLAGAAWGVVWLVLVALVALARRPHRARVGAATSELGPESPVVANLVAHRFRPTHEAVPAVVLDLAARRVVEIIELPGGEQHVLHVPAEDPPGLSEVEQLVLDHLQSKAVRGVVPAPAMTTGPQGASDAWWKRVRKASIAEAQAAGLCRPVWAGAWVRLLAVAGLGPIALGAWGNSLADEGEASAWFLVVAAVAVPCVLVSAALLKSDRQRDTPEGLAAAGRWLGVGAHLGETDRYEQATPGSVALDGRHLAYACTLGLTPVCVARLPLGVEDDKLAWSRQGGRWRPVRVRYPRWRAGWGRHPGLAVLVGLGLLVLAVGPLVVLARDDVDGLFLAVVAVPAVPIGVRGLLLLGRGLLDSRHHDVVDGLVVRARRVQVGGEDDKFVYWVAVDDGSDQSVRAWRVRPRIYGDAPQDKLVRAIVTPRLGYVREVQDAAPWGPPTP